MQRNMNKRQGQMLGSGEGAMGLAEAGVEEWTGKGWGQSRKRYVTLCWK